MPQQKRMVFNHELEQFLFKNLDVELYRICVYGMFCIETLLFDFRMNWFSSGGFADYAIV